MALIVQSLPTVAGANGYVSLEFFQAWAQERLKDLTGITPEKQEASIIDATSFIDTRWRFKGYRVDVDQTTEFPRNDLWDDRDDLVVGIPGWLQLACCEYAFRACRRDLWTDADVDATGMAVKVKTEEVGPLKTSTTYDSYSVGALPSYPSADRLITSKRVTVAGSGNVLGVTSIGLGG